MSEIEDDEISPLENAFKRKMMWGSASSVVSFSRFCKFFGIRNAAPRLVAWMGSKARLEGVTATIAGVNSVICGMDDCGEKKGVIVYLHGGGFAFGSLATMSHYTTILARDSGAIVVAVDYRLAPDHPYPAVLDDCLAVTKAVLDCNDQLPLDLSKKIDPRRVVLVGDSAGGTLVLTTALDLIRQGDNRVAGVLSICPWTQAITMGYQSYVKHNYLNKTLAWSLANYAGIADPPKELLSLILQGRHVSNETRRNKENLLAPSQKFEFISKILQSPNEEAGQSTFVDIVAQLAVSTRAWPLLAEEADLAKLPRTMVQVCTRDPLREEDLAFVERAKKAGAPNIDCHVLSFAQHCESTLASRQSMATQASRKGYEEVLKFIKQITNP